MFVLDRKLVKLLTVFLCLGETAVLIGPLRSACKGLADRVITLCL